MSCRDSGAERDGKDEREVLGGGGQTEGSCADRLAANEAAEMQEGSFMVGSKRSLSVAQWHANRVHMGRRTTLPAAIPCISNLCKGWSSMWSLPGDGQGFWSAIWSDITLAVGHGLGRWPVVTMVRDTELVGLARVRLHSQSKRSASCTGVSASQLPEPEERVLLGDVVVIHNDVDVLLVSCSQAVDDGLRRACSESGRSPAAIRVVQEAVAIQRGGGVLDWIREMNKECNNPAQLGHKSAGVTVDWGLHDGQTTYAVMLSTEIGRHRLKLPPSSHTLRARAYETHRAACLLTLSRADARHIARQRMSTNGAGQVAAHVMLPSLRLTSTPKADDAAAIAATEFEGVCRSAASDLSSRFFSSIPGVRALKAVQSALQWAESEWVTEGESGCRCPFRGGTDYLYTKGSIAQQGTKGWHDDANGPACLTCWQNLGEVAGEQLELVVAVHGCRVQVDAAMGKFVLFMAWLPHRTQLRGADGVARDQKGAVRLHHTAYVRMGTEYAGLALMEYKRQGLPLQFYVTR